MKTLVMFEAFEKLKSEPEIYDLGPGQAEINLPFLGTIGVQMWKDSSEPLRGAVKTARFRFVDHVQVPGWEFPIRKYVLVDV